MMHIPTHSPEQPLQLAQDYAHSGPRPQAFTLQADILKDTVSAMEYDFTIRLSIMVGCMDRKWKMENYVSCQLSRMGSL